MMNSKEERCDAEVIDLVGSVIKTKYRVETGMTENEDFETDLLLYTSAGTKSIEVKSRNRNYYPSKKFPVTPEQFGDGNIIVLNADCDGGVSKWDKIISGVYDGFIAYDKPTKTLYLFSIHDLIKANKGHCTMEQNHNKNKKMWIKGGCKRRKEDKVVISLSEATRIINIT